MTGSYFHRTETAFFLRRVKYRLLPPDSASLFSCCEILLIYLALSHSLVTQCYIYLLLTSFFSCNWQHVSSHWKIRSVTLYLVSKTPYSLLSHLLSPFSNDNLKRAPLSIRIPQFFPFLSADQDKCVQLRMNACDHKLFTSVQLGICHWNLCLPGQLLLAAMRSSWDAVLMALGQKYLVLISFYKQCFNKSPLQNCY